MGFAAAILIGKCSNKIRKTICLVYVYECACVANGLYSQPHLYIIHLFAYIHTYI